MEPIIIGIAGGSGSGKSTFTNRLRQYFGDDVAVIYHDNYYRRQDGIPFEQRVKVNYTLCPCTPSVPLITRIA